MSKLSDQLALATIKADHAYCPACGHLAGMEPGEEVEMLADALAGSIGVRTLAKIFSENDIPVGRRVIERHRRERH